MYVRTYVDANMHMHACTYVCTCTYIHESMYSCEYCMYSMLMSIHIVIHHCTAGVYCEVARICRFSQFDQICEILPELYSLYLLPTIALVTEH